MKNLLNERSRKLFQKLFENQGIDTAKYENYSREIREEGKPVEVAVVDWENAYDQVTWLFKVNGQDLQATSTGGIHTDDLADHIADALGEPYEDNPEAIAAIQAQIENSPNWEQMAADAQKSINDYAEDEFAGTWEETISKTPRKPPLEEDEYDGEVDPAAAALYEEGKAWFDKVIALVKVYDDNEEALEILQHVAQLEEYVEEQSGDHVKFGFPTGLSDWRGRRVV
jgi:hypothetical protein